MPRPKIDRLLLVLIPIILPLLLLFSPAYAEIKTFVEEYIYQASEADSKISSRVIALEQVKRLLLEKLGTYLESETEVKNFQLTKDQIVILTAGIVRAEIIEEKWDGKTYFLKSKMVVDPENVYTSIDKLRQDRQKTKELEETRKKADEALREVKRLKKELEIPKAGRTERDQYKGAVNRLSATDWFDKGYALTTAGKYQEAVVAYARAIELDPKYAWAYYGRGHAYGRLGDPREAFKDFNRAIELDPKYLLAYLYRGAAYGKLGDYDQEIRDYDNAIELDPKYAVAYFFRALAYYHLGDPQAFTDFDRAIELNPKYAEAYYNRGLAYGHLGDHLQAIKDLKTAAKLGYTPAQDYLNSKGISW